MALEKESYEMRGIRRSATLAAIAVSITLNATVAQAGQVGWDKYMNSAANVAAIAAAVALVGNCSKPLEFDETRQDGQINLTVLCSGGEDEEAAVIVTFDDLGGTLIPNGYQFAG